MKSWLFLDTHERGRIRFGWMASDGANVRTMNARAGDVLISLARDHSRLRRAAGVCVVAGPGSFSAVRTGVLYANLISRLLRVPLVGVRCEEAQDLLSLARKLASGSSASSAYVSPIYDAEPNITFSAHP